MTNHLKLLAAAALGLALATSTLGAASASPVAVHHATAKAAHRIHRLHSAHLRPLPIAHHATRHVAKISHVRPVAKQAIRTTRLQHHAMRTAGRASIVR